MFKVPARYTHNKSMLYTNHARRIADNNNYGRIVPTHPSTIDYLLHNMDDNDDDDDDVFGE